MGRVLVRTVLGTVGGWVLLGLMAAATVVASPERLQFIGPVIPQNIPIGTSFILSESDTLRLDQRVLQRDIDYTFNVDDQAFQLSEAIVAAVTAADTLIVSYQTLPGWVTKRYGRELPSIRPQLPPSLNPSIVTAQSAQSGFGNQISISGAKTFRFSARSSGTSDFGQSLDLNVSGQLTPGVELIGTVSDRGIDPAYGTANSRISELDRINLTLQSKRSRAQIGDITVADD